MNRQELIETIKQKQSFLCVGLDPDLSKIPKHLLELEDPVFEFNKQIIDATKDLCVAYKPNLAFYESLGVKGLESFEKTKNYIPEGIFTIADAKRGDIGNTSGKYASAFFDHFGFDSITIAPYMGKDSVEPFLQNEGKWAILLALTSNDGARDFQFEELANTTTKERVFEKVIKRSREWGNESNLMYVVGATKANMLRDIRALIPDHFLLVPGVGAQGGSLQDVVTHGINKDCGLLVNSSRGIIYADDGEDFAQRSREAALAVQQEMAVLLEKHI